VTHWYRRPRWIVLLAVGGALVIGTVAFAIAWSNRGGKEVSTRDVVERYRTRPGAGDGDGGFLRPEAGVYRYRASGTERLSLASTEQQWGPTMPATVLHRRDGCWSLRIEYSTNHWQEQRYCPDATTLLDVGGTVFQKFDFAAFSVTDTSVFTCDPPSVAIDVEAAPGDRWAAACTGKSQDRDTEVTSAGTNTFVSVENVDVGGTTVRAYHYRLERTLSGDQSGTEDTHDWYSASTGLLLRSTRNTRVASPSPLGDVVYTEQGEFRLESLRPRR
jgi:hypothetical protein